MDKNKSIDGLAPRRPKKVTTSSVPFNTRSSKSAKAATKVTKTTKAAKAAKIAKTPKTIDTTTIDQINPATPIDPISPVTPTQPNPTTIKVTSPQPPAANTTKTAKTTKPTKPTRNTKTPTIPYDVTEDFLKPVQVFDFDESTGELKTADPATNPKENQRKMKEKKPISKKRKIITGIILAIVLILIGGITWLVIWGNDIIAKITGGQGNVFDLIFQDEHYEPLKTDENGRTNILAFGTSGYNMEGDEGNGTHDGAQLTDSIMVISLNQETGDLAMLSLPRDLKASPTCTATGKINEVYWCNQGGGDASTETEATAAKALMDEVSKILGIDFQYFAHLNWGSLIQIVDTLGGINITLDEGVYDYNYTKAVFEPGVEYTINGAEALGLARARHGTTSGDFTRGASQQKILIGIKNKVFEKDLSLTDIISLASTLGDNLRTNFSIDEMKTLAHLTANFDFDSMRQVSLIEPERLVTTGTIGGISYVLPAGGVGYYTKIQNYIAKMFSSDPRSYEDASILVLNGTGTPGIAAAEQTTLEEAGYVNISTGDAPTGEYTDTYTLYDLTGTKPGTKKLLEEKYSVSAKPAAELPTGIDTATDFVLILGGTPNTETE